MRKRRIAVLVLRCSVRQQQKRNGEDSFPVRNRKHSAQVVCELGLFFRSVIFFCHPTSLAQQATFCSPGDAAKAKGVKTTLETNKTRQKKLPGTATSNPITGTKQRQLIEVEKIGGHAELSC